VEREEEEERRRQRKEEQLLAKKKPVLGMQNFMSRFVVKEKTPPISMAEVGAENDSAVEQRRFQEFYLQKDMVLAPVHRLVEAARPSAASIDAALQRCAAGADATREQLLSSLQGCWSRTPRVLPARLRAGRPASLAPEGDDGLIIVDDVADADVAVERHPLPCMKLLQFHEDVRPPYFGTYTKTSLFVTGRRPLGLAAEMDYEYDSEEEWEPEPDDAVNVEMSDVEEEEEEEGAGGEEGEEDGWMVPHGYLSEDEGIGGRGLGEEGEDGEEGEGPEGDDEERKQRQQSRKAFQLQQAAKATEVKASFTLGCVWGKEALQHACLGKYTMVPLVPLPIDATEVEAPASPDSKSERKTQRGSISDELLPQLVRLVHGSASGLEKVMILPLVACTSFPFQPHVPLLVHFVRKSHLILYLCRMFTPCFGHVQMVEEFYRSPDDTSVVTKASLFRKLRDPAFCVKELRAPFSRQRYFVAEDVLAELNMKDLPLPEPTGLKDKPISAEKAAASDTSETMAVASSATEAKAGKVKGQKRERPGSLKLAMKTAAAKPKKRRVPIVLTEEDKSW